MINLGGYLFLHHHDISSIVKQSGLTDSCLIVTTYHGDEFMIKGADLVDIGVQISRGDNYVVGVTSAEAINAAF